MQGLNTFTKRYRLVCTLTYGDIYGQIVVWLGVLFAALAVALSMMATQPVLALVLLGLILVVTLPFLLFSFVTTLFNHIEVLQAEPSDASPYKQTVFTRSGEPD